MKTLILMIQGLFLIGLFSGCGSSDDNETAEHIGWVVGMSADGYGTIIHTTDSGKTWKREGNITTIPNVSIEDVAAADRLNVWAVGDGSPEANGTSYGTILHSGNAGESWERQGISESIKNVSFSGISAVNSDVAWAAGGDTGGESVIMYTDDGGSHWNRQTEGSFPNVNFGMISAADKDNVWAVGAMNINGSVSAFIARTTNGGENWELVNIDILEGVEGLIDVHAVTADIVWAVGTGGTVAITINGGKSWVRTGPPAGLLHVNGVCALDGKRAWIAVDSYSLFYTSDGGFTWTEQHKDYTDVPGLSGAYLGVTAMDENNAWVVGINSPQMQHRPIVLHTADGGKKWADQSSPANAWLRRVSFVGDVK